MRATVIYLIAINRIIIKIKDLKPANGWLQMGITIVLIFLFSVFGRQVMEAWSNVGYNVNLGSALFTVTILAWLVSEKLSAMLVLINILAGVIAWQMELLHRNELAHFLFFGMLAVQATGLGLKGFIVALSVCALDELLQWFLPYRVGEWRDVWLNVLCLTPLFLLKLAINSHKNPE